MALGDQSQAAPRKYAHCDLYLSEAQGVTPRVRFPLTAELEYYDRASQLFNWQSLMGRTVMVEFGLGKSPREVPQKVSALQIIEKENPLLAEIIKDVLAVHTNALSKIEGKFDDLPSKVKRLLPGETAGFGFKTSTREAKLSAALGVLTHTSAVRRNFLTSVNIKPWIVTIENVLTSLRNSSEISSGELIDIYMVHTHPGTGVPINDIDAQVFRDILVDFRKKFPDLLFHGTSVVVSAEDKGSLLFVDEFSYGF